MRTVRTGSFAPGKGKLTTDPKQIMNELGAFYSDLYDGRACADTGSFSSFFK